MRRLALFAGLALAAPGAAQQPAQPVAPTPAVAATVNGEPVPLAAVEAEVRKVQAAAGALTPRQLKQLRKDITGDLIDDLLVRQYLRQHGPAVDPAEVDKLFAGLTQALARRGETPADHFRKTGTTEAEARAQWAVMLKFNAFAEKLATDAELRKYLAAHADVFDGSAVRVSQIVVRVPADAPPGERAAARVKLSALRAEIAAGATTFAAAAKAHSVDPSAGAGGDVGFVSRRDVVLDPAVTAAAFALPAGEVGGPVDSPAGVHLVVVTGRKAGTLPAFEAVADWVREAFLDDIRANLVAQLRPKAAVTLTPPD